MKRFILFFTVIFFSINTFSQVTSDDLLKNIVEIKADKFTATDLTLLTLSDGVTTFQIKAYAEAPSNIISRDNFVAFFTLITTEMIKGLSNDENSKTSDLDEIIGNPDVIINCYMTKSGVQIEVKGDNGTNRTTMKWSDL